MDASQIMAELGRMLIPGRIGPAYRPLLGGVIADVWLYIILFLVIVLIFMQPEGSLITTILLALTVLFIFMDKVQAFNIVVLTDDVHICGLPTLLMRAGIAGLPLIVAGATKNPKARPIGVVAGLMAAAYLLALWAVEMQAVGICRYPGEL